MNGFIGILMLDTAFERITGDAGNPASYHLPARTCVIDNAGSPDIVRHGRPAPGLVSAFCAAAQQLEADGAIALASTCGFLITVQQDIAGSVRVPVMLSALTLFPVIRAIHGARPIGIITASSQQLGPAVLAAAGIRPDQAAIAGMQDVDAFASCFLMEKSRQRRFIDQGVIQGAVVDKATALCDATPGIAAIVLECGNLPPYAAAITDATGRPVYSILDGMKVLAR